MRDIIDGKTVLITGGTGFLGRQLVRQMLAHAPHSIRVFSRDEVKHHRVQEEFDDDPRLRYLIGDVRDFARLDKALRGVDLVIHAAALKRLDILEYNVEESIKTNILGTVNVVRACLENDVERAVFVSTDKACSPVNTYGACKFVGERIFTESNYSKGSARTVLNCVRYGNVLESTGSVIPLFESKIVNDQEVPLTDPRMTRFIISHEQAVALIVDALRYGIGGEVFIPKLPAFKVTDLIEVLGEKHGKRPVTTLIGLRPGEKIHEVMLNSSEVSRTIEYRDRYVILSSIEKYQHGKRYAETAYVREGRRLAEGEMAEYSSQDAVISKEQVVKLFKEIGLLR